MWSLISFTLRGLSLAICLALAGLSASAGPLEIFAHHDSPNQAFAVFNHGPISPGETTHTLSLGTFWRIKLNVLEIGSPPLDADGVSIAGTLQHIEGPHGEGPGQIFDFGLIFNARFGNSTFLTFDIGPKELPHEQHKDTVFAGIQWLTNSEKTRILFYSLTVYGNHPDPIPETETILLFGTGLAGLGLVLGRKRAVS